MYSFFIFLFGEGNTVADGVAFAGLWIVGIWMVINLVESFIWVNLKIDWNCFPTMEWQTVYAPIDNLTVIFQSKIHTQTTHSIELINRITQTSYMYVAWGFIGILCCVGYFITATKKRAESVGDISTSRFGYRFLIPLLGYALFMADGMDGVYTLIVYILMLIGYVVYRRSFRIQKKDIIILICGIIPMLLGEMLF